MYPWSVLTRVCRIWISRRSKGSQPNRTRPECHGAPKCRRRRHRRSSSHSLSWSGSHRHSDWPQGGPQLPKDPYRHFGKGDTRNRSLDLCLGEVYLVAGSRWLAQDHLGLWNAYVAHSLSIGFDLTHSYSRCREDDPGVRFLALMRCLRANICPDPSLSTGLSITQKHRRKPSASPTSTSATATTRR